MRSGKFIRNALDFLAKIVTISVFSHFVRGETTGGFLYKCIYLKQCNGNSPSRKFTLNVPTMQRFEQSDLLDEITKSPLLPGVPGMHSRQIHVPMIFQLLSAGTNRTGGKTRSRLYCRRDVRSLRRSKDSSRRHQEIRCWYVGLHVKHCKNWLKKKNKKKKTKKKNKKKKKKKNGYNLMIDDFIHSVLSYR